MTQRKNNTPKKSAATTPPKSATRPTAKPTSSTLTGFWHNTRLHLIGLFLFGFLLYANTLTHDYAVDDAIVITENDFVKKGFAGVGDILVNDTFLGFFKVKKNLVAGGRYRPLSLVTFAAEYQFFGESPAVSHTLNVLLYAFSGVLLYLIVLQFFKKTPAPTANFVALATAALFLSHPIHTEAVANIKGRDEIMALLGSLAALYFALRYVAENKFWQVVAVGVCFFLGLLSKENTITFLAVVPLAMFVFAKATKPQMGAITAVLATAAGVFLALRGAVLGDVASLTANANMELMNNPYLKWTGTQYVEFSAAEKLGTIIYTLGKYLVLLLVPHPLTHDYYPAQIPMKTFGDWQVLVTVAVYAAAIFYALWRLPKRDAVAFGVLYFVATLSIVSNLVFPIGTNMSERFMYMPSVGFALIMAVLLSRLTATKPEGRLNLGLALPVLAVVLVAFSVKTVVRNTAWKDNYTLFSTDIKTSTNSAKLNNAMAGVTIEEANKPQNAAQKTALLQQALQYGQQAATLHPTYANPYLLMGNAAVYLEDYETALKQYDYVLSITGAGASDYQNAINNKGLALAQLQTRELKAQNFAGALAFGKQAIDLGQRSVELFGQQGAAFGALGRHAEALQMFQEVLKIDPNSAQAYLNIGFAYRELKDEANANANFERAYALDPKLRQ